ncbi:MAG: zf-TFIIB domain-containing protein [Candidatus Margulisiibacteriota bacterium]|jgi:Zn-finger nucleic acid-binding protein
MEFIAVDVAELQRRLYLGPPIETVRTPRTERISLAGRACPKCDGHLKNINIHDRIFIDKCEKCKGIWLDHGEFDDVLKLDPRIINKIEQDAPADQKPSMADDLFYFDKDRNIRTCPRCSHNLRETYLKVNNSIYVDVCDFCRGVYYDHGKLSKVMEEIDNRNNKKVS